MSTINKFEDLGIWKKAREICLLISQLTVKENFSKNYALVNQISRSSGSVMDNIAEGFERGGKKEFIQFLYIAKGSAGEVRSQLYRALDLKYITQIEFENACANTTELSKQLAGFIKYLSQTDLSGLKSKFIADGKANQKEV